MSTSTKHSHSFAEAYTILNDEQRRAVDTIEGPVMVIAGPGTGKTQILTLRIANILLQTDTPPESILALTFTESGAKTMRNRLRSFIGSRAYRVPIYTFHGFADQLIRQYPDAYNRIIGGRPANDIEKVQSIEIILNDSQIKKLRPNGNPMYYVKPILQTIQDLKKENISPAGFGQIIAEQEVALTKIEQYHTKGVHQGKIRSEYTKLADTIIKNRELQFIYTQYEIRLNEQSLFDYEDMIVMTVDALEQDESMLRDLQEQYLYVLADEHQDVNGAQNRILELLSSYHDNPNIFVVGDEKQAIYRFQGASLDNFMYFEQRFKGTTVISLTRNYRSGQAILDLAQQLVEVDSGPLASLRIPLIATTSEETVITHRIYNDLASEHTALVEAIQTELKAGTEPAEIAVIVRTNQEVENLSQVCKEAGIAIKATAERDVLSHPITYAVEALIAATVVDHPEQGLFSIIQSTYSGVSLPDSINLLSRKQHQRSLYDYLYDESLLLKLGIKETSSVLRIGSWITTAREKMTVESPLRVIAYLVEASGLRDLVMKQQPLEGGTILRQLYDDIEQYVMAGRIKNLADIITIFRQRRQYGYPLEATVEYGTRSAVQVMTAHKAKGLEFTAVFIPHLTDTRFGAVKNRTNFTIPFAKLAEAKIFDEIDDERRLLYVALTRAKRKLHLSSAKQSNDGKENVPSRLIEDLTLESKLIANADQSVSNLLSVFDTRTVYQEPLSLAIKEALTSRGFSATSFNNYYQNPWDYVYRNVLFIPEVKTTALQFGTVMHQVLEFYTSTHTKTGIFPSESEIIAVLTATLKKLSLADEEYTRLHEQGLSVIFIYLDHCQRTLSKITKEELSIKVMLPTDLPEIPEIILTGKLDRLDQNEDGTLRRVVDYKTGKPKTRNDIEGKTKASAGNYKRQLVFYALLLELYGDIRYQSRVGVISFIEPDSKGKIHEEEFNITDDEIADLKKAIILASKELVSGEAFTPESLTASKYAQLAKELVKKGGL